MTPAELLAARHTMGLTQIEFAERMGVTATTVSRWENGKSPLAPRTIKAVEALLWQQTTVTEDGA